MARPLRFAVMGDTHYVQPDSHREAFGGRPRGVTELVDLKRNLWFTQHQTPEVIAAIAAQEPDFVIQTGDVIQGHCDDDAGAVREMAEALEMLRGLNKPTFFAFASHDGVLHQREDAPLKACLLPALSSALGRPLDRGYYSFERGRSLFVILDYCTFAASGEQAAWLAATLAERKKYEHVFLFGHVPLIAVGRPFFSPFDYVTTVLRDIENHPVDAYFCGHTHNQVATLHRHGGRWLPHLKSTILGFAAEPPVQLADVRPLLPDPTSYEYGWGFLEDSAPGWWLVTVEGEAVRAEWHVLRQGVQGEVQWRADERPQFTRRPSFDQGGPRRLPLSGIRSVRLRVAGSGCKSEGAYAVSLNGGPVGRLPRLEYFDCRQFLPIREEHWGLLAAENTLTVTTGKEPMCIGGFVLEVETASGWVRSRVAPHYYANTPKWDRWQAPPLRHIEPGATLELGLAFASESRQRAL